MDRKQQQKMQDGKRKAKALREREKARAEREFSKWVRIDARLYADLQTARESGNAARARQRWLDNLRNMPKVTP